MLELVYPQEHLPVMFGASDEPASEMLPVIETSGLVVGQASRKECHSRSLLHPVVRLLAVNRAGEFFLRATTQPLPDTRNQTNTQDPTEAGVQTVWDNAAEGHVAFGEKCTEALYREAADKIGLRQFHPIYLASYLDNTGGKREMVNLYATVGDFELKEGKSPKGAGDQGAECGWWTPDRVEEMLGKGVFTPGFEFDWKNFKDKVLALL